MFNRETRTDLSILLTFYIQVLNMNCLNTKSEKKYANACYWVLNLISNANMGFISILY